jgi:hypothetical protein
MQERVPHYIRPKNNCEAMSAKIRRKSFTAVCPWHKPDRGAAAVGHEVNKHQNEQEHRY